MAAMFGRCSACPTYVARPWAALATSFRDTTIRELWYSTFSERIVSRSLGARMSEDEVAPQRIPGVSDRGVRRFRIFSFDFDSRPRDLLETPGEGWNEEARKQ
jgi:hypothetical protein